MAVAAVLAGGTVLADDESPIDEVIVTANRREASAQEIPISITAVSGAALEAAGITDVASLSHNVAGVNYTDKGPFSGVNGANLIIRGLNSEATAGQLALATPIVPPVATYVDDTPLFVNLRLQDLDHVEILRGPQGTLYGSGSLGGTIRFVQNAPDPRAFSASAEAGISDTAHTHAPNEDVRGVLNLPVNDQLAFRFNASSTNEAGFINQPDLYRLDANGAPVAAQPGVLLSPPATYARNGTNAYGYRTARAAALWLPSDGLRVQLSYYYQRSTASGFPYASPQYGIQSLSSTDHLQASTSDEVNLAALVVEANLGFATLTSDTSWAHHGNVAYSDLTDLYTNFPFYPSLYGANPRALVTGHDRLDDRPVSQELRLVSRTGAPIDWVAGLFYKSQTTNIQEHEYYPGYNDYFNACVPAYGVSNGDGVTPSQCGIGETSYVPGTTTYIDGIPIVKDQAYIGDFETSFKDMALFGETTWHVSDQWSLTAGARVFKQEVSQAQQTGLLFDGPTSIANVALSDSWRKALWKFNAAYQIDKTNLAYATWSQGFRRGGVNALPPTEPAVSYVTNPGLYRVEPDKADNYELGIKGTIENRFRYAVALFDIQWHNVQEGAQLTPLVLPGAINVGDAYSRGVESEFFVTLTSHWAVQADYTYDDARLKSLSALAVQGLAVPPPAPGAPMPGTPKSSAAIGVEFNQRAVANGDLRASVNAHYESALVPALSATIPTVPGRTTVDARVGLTWSQWSAALYVDNLTNRVGVSSYSDPSNYQRDYQAVVSRPRTVGLTVGYRTP